MSAYRNKPAEPGVNWIALIETLRDAFPATVESMIGPFVPPAAATGLPLEVMQPAINFRRRFYRFDA